MFTIIPVPTIRIQMRATNAVYLRCLAMQQFNQIYGLTIYQKWFISIPFVLFFFSILISTFDDLSQPAENTSTKTVILMTSVSTAA